MSKKAKREKDVNREVPEDLPQRPGESEKAWTTASWDIGADDDADRQEILTLENQLLPRIDPRDVVTG